MLPCCARGWRARAPRPAPSPTPMGLAVLLQASHLHPVIKALCPLQDITPSYLQWRAKEVDPGFVVGPVPTGPVSSEARRLSGGGGEKSGRTGRRYYGGAGSLWIISQCTRSPSHRQPSTAMGTA